MPIKRVQYPDGSIHRVEVPEGATNEQILAFVQSQNGQPPEQSASPILVDLPDGRTVEFPAGTPREVMERAIQTYQAEQGKGQQPTRLQKIEQALRKADAAGNVEDARTLARAYVEERDRPQAPRYSQDELFRKLERADAAGDTEAATVIADEIRRMQKAPQADFSGVSGQAYTQAASDIRPGAHTPLDSGPAALAAPGQGTMALRGPGGQSDPTAEAANRAQMFNELPMPARFAIGVGSSVASTGRGLGQLYAAGADAIAPRPHTLGGLLTGADPSRAAMMQQREARAREMDEPIRNDLAGVAGQFVGDVTQTAFPMSRIGLAGTAGNYARAVGTGAAYGATRPVVEGESRAANTALAGAAGGIGQGIGHGFHAMGQRAPAAVRELYEAAKARGIHLTPAQLSDSKAFQFFQSQLSRMPGSGATARASQDRTAWNRAVARTIGEDADAVTPEVFAQAKLRHSQQFDELTSRNSLKVNDGLIRKLGEIEEEAAIAGGDVQASVRAAIDSFYHRAQTNAGGVTVPGAAFQALDTQLGQITKLGTPMSHFVGKVQGAIRSAMDDSISPADRAAWRQLREEYGNRKTIRDLVSRESGADISPRALMGRVTANNSGKERMATGTRGELGQLARIGQRMQEPPSSGTAERLMNYGVGAGAVTNAPVTLAALLAGSGTRRALDSRGLARLLMSENRGRYATPAGRISQPMPLLATSVFGEQ